MTPHIGEKIVAQPDAQSTQRGRGRVCRWGVGGEGACCLCITSSSAPCQCIRLPFHDLMSGCEAQQRLMIHLQPSRGQVNCFVMLIHIPSIINTPSRGQVVLCWNIKTRQCKVVVMVRILTGCTALPSWGRSPTGPDLPNPLIHHHTPTHPHRLLATHRTHHHTVPSSPTDLHTWSATHVSPKRAKARYS